MKTVFSCAQNVFELQHLATIQRTNCFPRHCRMVTLSQGLQHSSIKFLQYPPFLCLCMSFLQIGRDAFVEKVGNKAKLGDAPKGRYW